MNIIVLGNGFDLAHGLPTRYTDFLKYCHDYDNNHSPISTEKEIEKKFKENIANNMWLEYFRKITLDLHDDKTWIDFETEILEVIYYICYTKWRAEAKNEPAPPESAMPGWLKRFKETKHRPFTACFLLFENEPKENAGQSICNYELPTTYIARIYTDLRKFTRAFELYCCAVINDRCGVIRRYKLNRALLNLPKTLSETASENYIVSFNYTRTFNRFYDVESDGDSCRYSYVYPHGEACIDILYEPSSGDFITSGLVLGTKSFDHDNRNYNIPLEFNVFQKHNQQHRYSTLADFQSLLLKLRKSSETKEDVNIYILGHSLNVSDHAKLKHLLSENKEAKITVFYHDEERFQQYINNITDILGESDVAVRVKFFHQNNPTFGLLTPYWIFEDGRISTDVIENAETVLQEVITDFFRSPPLPEELESHILATNIFVNSVAINKINKIEMVDVNKIRVTGSAEINVETQIVSNSDFNNGNDVVNNKAHFISFDIYLTITERAKNEERYEIDKERSQFKILEASSHNKTPAR